MADRPSSTAATMWKTFLRPFRDCIERPKSANASTSPSNPTRVSVSIERPKSANASASPLNPTRISVPSASGAHDPVPGNDAGSAEQTALSKYIGSILVISDSTSLQVATLPWIRVCTVLDSYFADLVDSAHHLDPPTTTFQDYIEQPKSVNTSASLLDPTRVSVSSASDAHNPVPENDAGSEEQRASSKYIGSVFVLSGSTSSRWQCYLGSGYVLSWV